MDLMQHTVAAMDKILANPRPLPHAPPRADGEVVLEDFAANLRIEWRDVTRRGEDLTADVIRVFATFGSDHEVEIPLRCFGPKQWAQLQQACNDDLQEVDAGRAFSLRHGGSL